MVPIYNPSSYIGNLDSITKDFNGFDRDNSIRGLNERDVEIEHLKTTVIALNEKVEVSELIHCMWISIMVIVDYQRP